jgi:hypothetical protein
MSFVKKQTNTLSQVSRHLLVYFYSLLEKENAHMHFVIAHGHRSEAR